MLQQFKAAKDEMKGEERIQLQGKQNAKQNVFGNPTLVAQILSFLDHEKGEGLSVSLVCRSFRDADMWDKVEMPHIPRGFFPALNNLQRCIRFFVGRMVEMYSPTGLGTRLHRFNKREPREFNTREYCNNVSRDYWKLAEFCWAVYWTTGSTEFTYTAPNPFEESSQQFIHMDLWKRTFGFAFGATPRNRRRLMSDFLKLIRMLGGDAEN